MNSPASFVFILAVLKQYGETKTDFCLNVLLPSRSVNRHMAKIRLLTISFLPFQSVILLPVF